jgi:HK97 family phage prohead protease
MAGKRRNKLMKVTIRADSVELEGYVNAVERNSKPLWSSLGYFFERICAGAFGKALKRAQDVKILLNHDESRELGSISKGNLKLDEDSIGLKFWTRIDDPQVIDLARKRKLVGCSFGFYDREIEQGIEQGLPLRKVRDLDLDEVSILDDSKTPAYDGTLISVREDGRALQIRCVDDSCEIVDEAGGESEESAENPQDETSDETETRNEPEQTNESDGDKNIDYSKYEQMISEMKGD